MVTSEVEVEGHSWIARARFRLEEVGEVGIGAWNMLAVVDKDESYLGSGHLTRNLTFEVKC